MSKKTISKILSIYEREQIRLRMRSGVTKASLLSSYKSYFEKDKKIIKTYIENELRFIYSVKSMGHKNEPYYEKEEDMEIPKYSWKNLSDDEKNFFNKYNPLINDKEN